MAAEQGHFPNRTYWSQDGDTHLNGGNLFDGAEAPFAQQVTFSPAAGGANVSLVTIQVKDGRGANLTKPVAMLVYLSDDSAGNGLTGTTASGAVAAGASGTDLSAKVSKKAIDALTDATGKYILSITDTGKTGFFVCAICPGTGNVQVSTQLTAANYG